MSEINRTTDNGFVIDDETRVVCSGCNRGDVCEWDEYGEEIIELGNRFMAQLIATQHYGISTNTNKQVRFYVYSVYSRDYACNSDGKRRQLPICVEIAIKNTWPSNANEFTGFRDVNGF